MTDTTIALPRGLDWQAIRTACRTPQDRKRLSDAHAARWTSQELTEYARSCHRRRNRDYATPHSFRSALAHHGSKDALLWCKLFRERGSTSLPPRSPQELKYLPGPAGIGSNHRYWPFHSPELITMIDQRTRDYFNIPEGASIHPHAWIASYLWWKKEQAALVEAVSAVPGAPKSPKAHKSPKANPAKLAPQYNRSWPGHSPAFVAKVDARVIEHLRGRGYSGDLKVTDTMWKRICNRDYVLA